MAPALAPLRLLSPAAAEETDGAGARRLGSEPAEPPGSCARAGREGPAPPAPTGAAASAPARPAPAAGRRPPGASASRSESLGPGEDRCRIRERFLEIICMENHVFYFILMSLHIDVCTDNMKQPSGAEFCF
ncbi:homeobox protein unc-4 homolog [Neofelis nebulosa]|uniref:homeobox protein unc-4 homolog n=1 Tax=Neofelis nebulosa TaxID=61452 RepID=UPI00272C0487|nr:homeobox protein unc-4 homolog [Neofelis nebulosa]